MLIQVYLAGAIFTAVIILRSRLRRGMATSQNWTIFTAALLLESGGWFIFWPAMVYEVLTHRRRQQDALRTRAASLIPPRASASGRASFDPEGSRWH